MLLAWRCGRQRSCSAAFRHSMPSASPSWRSTLGAFYLRVTLLTASDCSKGSLLRHLPPTGSSAPSPSPTPAAAAQPLKQLPVVVNAPPAAVAVAAAAAAPARAG